MSPRAASLAHENAQAAGRSNEVSRELGQLAGPGWGSFAYEGE
ncbi:hypothetical protein [Pseudomonas lini]